MNNNNIKCENARNKSNNFVYIFSDKIYINLTNSCNCDCVFCVRKNHDGVDSDSLWLSREPEFDDVELQLEKYFDINKNTNKYSNEVIFCGYGESTYRLETMIQVAKHCHDCNYTTRLNTNGLGSIINNISNAQLVSRLVGMIDSVSISLNAPNSATYNSISRPKYVNDIASNDIYSVVVEFGALCKAHNIDTSFSVVDILTTAQIEQTQAICDNLGIALRVRERIK